MIEALIDPWPPFTFCCPQAIVDQDAGVSIPNISLLPLDEVPVHVHRFAARAPCDSKGSECQCGIHRAETASALRSRKTERAAKEKPTPISHIFFSTCSAWATAFREAQVTIDGRPAGVAPVYPWIYTGGIDPLLWRPIPGVQALNFVPYRVDLTPFAGVLSNGQEHQVAVSVFNADRHFSTTASLLLYLDHGSTQVTGEVMENTIGNGPTPDVDEDLTTTNGVISGTVTVRSSRRFTTAGFVKTSHGKVHTEVEQKLHFSNRQEFNISASTYVQNIRQTTRISSVTRTKDRGMRQTTSKELEWPLTVDFS